MVSFDEFTAELKAFEGRKEVLNEIRRELRKPALLADLRTRVRWNAIAVLPSGGGLGAWVAKARMSIQIRDSGRTAGIRVKLGRKSGKGKAALEGLDNTGRVRHPVYGDRRQWFGQQVASRFFSNVWDQYADRWITAADDALDRALDKIRRG